MTAIRRVVLISPCRCFCQGVVYRKPARAWKEEAAARHHSAGVPSICREGFLRLLSILTGAVVGCAAAALAGLIDPAPGFFLLFRHRPGQDRRGHGLLKDTLASPPRGDENQEKPHRKMIGAIAKI